MEFTHIEYVAAVVDGWSSVANQGYQAVIIMGVTDDFTVVARVASMQHLPGVCCTER